MGKVNGKKYAYIIFSYNKVSKHIHGVTNDYSAFGIATNYIKFKKTRNKSDKNLGNKTHVSLGNIVKLDLVDVKYKPLTL